MRTPSCSLGSSLVYFNGILCVPECKLCTSDAKLAAVLPSLNFPLCMSVCVCGMCRCVDRHSQDCACKGRDQRRTPGVLLHHSGPLRRSLTEPGASRQPVNPAGSSVSTTHMEVTRVHQHSQLLSWVPGSQVLLLCHLSSPYFIISDVVLNGIRSLFDMVLF